MNREDIVVRPSGVRFMGQHFPCTIGRGGITDDKKEGDGATPRGTHYIAQMFYRPDRIAKPADWAQPIGLNDGWCDAPDHPDYNHLIQKPFAHSHEDMRRADPMYDLVMTTDWNWPHAAAGKGSAIFIHNWRRRCAPTAGCVAFHPLDLLWIAQQVTPRTRLIVV
ncbi:MAG: L,D-transpeptidase family protein [Planktomarina sp.]